MNPANPQNRPANSPADGSTPIVCPSCEREVPGTALYCPYCCGDDGRSGAMTRGAFIGGIFGLLAGGLAAAFWSSLVGPEQATWWPVLAIALGGGGGGMIIGALSNRRS